MVTTLTLPSSALGFTLDSNNQYIISVTLVMKEIIKMVASLNSSVSLYLRHHNIKYKYIFYINGTVWKSSNGYINLTNTNVSFSNENISGYLNSSLKQTLSCTVEVSHPQFYCKLNSENYTFIIINKKSQQLKAKNASTGQYETIGLSFSNLSSSEKSGIDNIRWPLFNTENSSQQFVIPIGSASYTRRNGSIRAERFGGSAGQYFNLSTSQFLNKDFSDVNGTEYRYVDSFTPTLRYYTEYSVFKYHDYTTTSSSEWSNPTKAAPTLTTGENETGRYTSYAFGSWRQTYNFRIDYFTDGRVYAPHASTTLASSVSEPKYSSLPYTSGTGLNVDASGNVYVHGRDFRVSYRDAVTYKSSAYWPAYESFLTGGSAELGGEARYSSDTVFNRWDFAEGRKDYYYCVGRYYNERDDELRYYSTLWPWRKPPNPTEKIYESRYYSGWSVYKYYEKRNYVPYGEYNRRYYYEKVTTQKGSAIYEKWTAQYIHPFLGYYFYLTERYDTKSSTITGTLYGIEYEYRRWWDYETRTNWYIDSNNNIQYYNSSQVKITNDTNTYRTS